MIYFIKAEFRNNGGVWVKKFQMDSLLPIGTSVKVFVNDKQYRSKIVDIEYDTNRVSNHFVTMIVNFPVMLDDAEFSEEFDWVKTDNRKRG